jgi:hypothetical protein
LGESDIIKVLQLQPGVSGGIEGFAGMYVRGGNNDENLYLIDGTPLYQVNHLGGFLSPFNTEAISSIDFYKSSFPVKYGSRLSSVLDVHTKNGDLNNYHGTAMIGLTSGNLNFEGPIVKNKTSFNISVRRTWFDLLSMPALSILNKKDKKNGKESTGHYNFTDINLKVNHKFNGKNNAYINFYYGKDKFEFGTRSFSIDDKFYESKNNNQLDWGNILTSLGWLHKYNHNINSDIKISYTSSNSYFQRTTQDILDTEDEYYFKRSKTTTKNGIDDLSLQMNFNYKYNEKHELNWGANYIFHNYRPQNITTQISADSIDFPDLNSNQLINANEINAFMEYNWDITPTLKVAAGLRFNFFNIENKDYLSIEPRITSRLMLNPQISIKASYSRMQQYVQQLTENYVNLPTDFWMPINHKFKPLESDQITIGSYYNHNNQYLFSIEYYYKQMRNLLDYKDGYDFLSYATSWEDKLTSGKGWSHGAELILKKETGIITGFLGYGLMWNNRQFKEINKGEIFPAKYDNRHKFNILAIWKLNEKIEINGSWTYMTGNRVTLSLENYQDLGTSGFPPLTVPTNPYQDDRGIDYFDTKNNVRLPAYHRLDVSMNIYKPKKNGRLGILTISVYNVYSRLNPMVIQKNFIYSQYAQPVPQFQTLGIFPIIPSVSYTYKF